MKRKLRVSGLDCAHCASKIEALSSTTAGIRWLRIDFVQQHLEYEADGSRPPEEIEAELVKKGRTIEPEFALHHTAQHRTSAEGVIDINLAIGFAGILLFAAALAELMPQLTLFFFGAAWLCVGWPVIRKSYSTIKNGQLFDENVLMTLATVGAFAVGEYPEAVAVFIFYRIGEYLQQRALQRSRNLVKTLLDIRPDTARIVNKNGEVTAIPAELVRVGEVMEVRPGERIPLDGELIEGESFIDFSTLTGEAVPVRAVAGALLPSGVVVQSGLIQVRVMKVFGESTATRIVELAENAASRKAKTEQFITRFARYYTPAVVAAAALLATIPPLFSAITFADSLHRALVFLVVSCPCALVISIPLAYFGGIGAASRRGILVKGGNYLDLVGKAGTVVFDKTGTLTKGEFAVAEIAPAAGISTETLLMFAASAEQASTHPIARSIMQAAQGLILQKPQSVQEEAGRGVRALFAEGVLLAGSLRFLSENNVAAFPPRSVGTTVYIALNGSFIGSITIADTVRGEAIAAIASLRAAGVSHLAMITGDAQQPAESVAAALALDSFAAGLLPHQKVEELERIMLSRSGHGPVVFVGDGINDAPVLARADIGISMGGIGTDAAIEASDVVIMEDKLTKLAEAVHLARKTRRVVYQNIVLALGVKALVLVLGAAAVAGMWEAVFADVGVALLAVVNATRLIRN